MLVVKMILANWYVVTHNLQLNMTVHTHNYVTVSGKTNPLAEIKISLSMDLGSSQQAASWNWISLISDSWSPCFLYVFLLVPEGHRADSIQESHTLSTSYFALVGQLFQPNRAQEWVQFFF